MGAGPRLIDKEQFTAVANGNPGRAQSPPSWAKEEGEEEEEAFIEECLLPHSPLLSGLEEEIGWPIALPVAFDISLPVSGTQIFSFVEGPEEEDKSAWGPPGALWPHSR